MRHVFPALVLAVAAATVRAEGAAAPESVSVAGTDGALAARLVATPAHPAPGVAVELRLEADAPADAGARIVWPDVRGALLEALGDEVVEVERARAAPDGRSFAATIRLYDEGAHELPPLVVTAQRGDVAVGTVELAGLTLQVDVDVPAEAEPAPPRQALPLELPPAPFPWLPAAAAALAVAGLVAGLLAWRRRTLVAPPPPPPAPPHAKALAALRALAARALPERGEVEPYFVELSEILRTYLEERFGLRAPEQTTEEFLAAVSRTDAGRRAIESAHRDLLRDFLTRSDLVKFARARPGTGECAAAGTSVERFVHETTPATAPAEAAP